MYRNGGPGLELVVSRNGTCSRVASHDCRVNGTAFIPHVSKRVQEYRALDGERMVPLPHPLIHPPTLTMVCDEVSRMCKPSVIASQSMTYLN